MMAESDRERVKRLKCFRILAFSVIVVSGIGAWSSASAGELVWKPFVSEKGRFSVMMLGEPQCTETDEPTPLGPVRENLFSITYGQIMLDAEYTNLPFLAALFGGRSRIYRDIVNEFLKRAHATEIGFETFTFDAYRGRILTYETSTRYGKLWMLLISRRIHVLHASVPKDSPDRSVIDTYFQSFKPIYKTSRQLH
jgi:hypothetical protein